MSKNKWKINGIDIILSSVIAFIFLALVNIFFYGNLLIDISAKEKVTMIVAFEDVEHNHAHLIKENDSAVLNNNKELGAVITKTEIRKENNARNLNDNTQNTVRANIELEVNVKDGRYYIDGNEYRVGDTINVSLSDFTSNAKIESFIKIEG